MSDEDNGEEQETMFTCKKCPGVYFREEEKDSHRLKHRTEKQNLRTTRNSSRKPGPRSRQQPPGRRHPSPTPSTATLFSVRQVTPPPEELSQPSRKRKAEADHQKKSKKVTKRTKRQTNGG